MIGSFLKTASHPVISGFIWILLGLHLAFVLTAVCLLL